MGKITWGPWAFKNVENSAIVISGKYQSWVEK
jgi:hypothetical protein